MPAITLVGGIQGTGGTNGNDVTIIFSPAPVAGDVVYLWGGHGNATNTIGPSTGGYTTLVSDTSTNCKFGVWRKVMGSTPDTQVVGQGGGNAADAVDYLCIVLRGVDLASPEDATTTTANGTSTNPDCPSITTATDGAMVLALAASIVNDGTVTAPTNYTNGSVTAFNDTNPYSVAGAVRVISAHGAEDPASFTNWNSGVWFAASVAVRRATPEPAHPSRASSFQQVLAQ